MRRTFSGKHAIIIAMQAIFIISLFFIGCKAKPQLPVARIEKFEDVYHGVSVADPYRWLENWNDPAVRAWSNRQNVYAREYLDHLPAVEQIRQRVREIYQDASASYYDLSWCAGKLFAMKNQPPLNQPLLVFLNDPNSPADATVIMDLNLMSEGSIAVDWYRPSPDGKLVAVSLSHDGSEKGDLSVYRLETGEKLQEEIPRVNRGTAGGDLAWLADGSGFYYTRYPAPGERPEDDLNFFQEVWFHRLGTPVNEDHYVIGEEFPRIAEIRLELDETGGMLLVTTQYGDGGEFSHYLVDAQGGWRKITEYEDQITDIRFGPDQSLILVSRKNTPRGEILRLPLSDPRLSGARVLIPQIDGSVVSEFGGSLRILPLPGCLVVTYMVGGPSELRIYDYSGKQTAVVPILPLSTVHEIVPTDQNQVLYYNSSYVQPKTWYSFSLVTGEFSPLKISTVSSMDFSDCEIIRDYATSHDGTRIPINVIRLKSAVLDGSNPVLLYGYGGYGINQKPSFNPALRIWIEQGGVYAVANLRGGGEYGEEWHRAGMLTNKQNVFDDFAAAMEYMIQMGYTTPGRLAINGGSNGGLLMGAMITQHPDRFKAVVSRVGIYDMLRVELSPNGSFNIPEFGTVKNWAQFTALYAYSPYHQVKDGIAYPATLFMTGANDPRVDPMQSRKMTARLQAATGSDAPILLRTSSGTGHGSGTSREDKINEEVDKYTFLFYHLGVNYQPEQK